MHISNELLWLFYVILDLSVAVLLMRFFGKLGLFGVIIISSMLSNIQVTELVTLFGFTVAIGNVLYSSIFFATDLLSELYGKREAQKGVILGLVSIVIMTVYMQLLMQFTPAPFDKMAPHIKALFSLTPRVALGSIVAYTISQNIDVLLFHFWKGITGEKHLWLRNNGSTMISQFIDSLVFITIAFYGVVPMKIFWQILFSNYALKWAIALMDTAFIYWGVNWMKKLIKQGKSGF